MADVGKVHEVERGENLTILMTALEDGTIEGRRSDTGAVVGEKDRFLLREGASLGLGGLDTSRFVPDPTKSTCFLYLWREAEGREELQKDLATAQKLEAWSAKADPVVHPVSRKLFDDDVHVELGAGGAVLTHLAGQATHAHYQFEIVFRVEDSNQTREFVWDPDVHDMPPKT